MNYKTIVLILFVAVVFVGVGSGIFLNQVYSSASEDKFISALPVEGKQVKEASTNPDKLRAMLKGSIYESGEEVTVYGACFDGYGYLIPGSNATFSSWYPNGTQQFNESPMLDIDNSGRFRIQMNMSDTYGTYLTQITCWVGSDYAMAFGEWQNPDWVKRIKDTQSSVELLTNISIGQYNNISSLITQFQAQAQINFSQVLAAISSINTSSSLSLGDLDQKILDVYNMVHALDTSFWVIDTKAPWYSFGSNAFNFKAVDMLSLNDIFAVSEDGYVVFWDGETWQIKANYSDISWYGVSVLPASTPYAWFVGSNLSTNTSVYSVNGGTLATLIGSVGTAYFDVKLFPNPNSPSSNYFGYVLEDNGILWYSADNGISFSNPVNLTATCTPDTGRISQIIANTDLGVTSGYRAAFVLCDDFVYYNGTGYALYTEANQVFADVELVYNDIAYAVSKDSVTDELKVWKFNGTALSLVYKVNDTTIDPRGIGAASMLDIWVVTNNPSVYYHFDGNAWVYANYPYSGAIGLSILFTNGTIPGLYDISVFNAKNAYAVGTDGLVMKFYDVFDENFDQVINDIANLSNTLNLSILGDIYATVVQINQSVNDLTTVVQGMNASMVSLFADLSNKVDALNLTINEGFDQIIANISYVQLYLNSTIYPILDLILTRLGVIETNVNATMQIVNETQVTVNQMNASINELINRTGRPRAWITQ